MNGFIGEVALGDIDKDGKLELITIEPFHGNIIKIYHLDNENKYQEVWSYSDGVEFAHALTSGTLMGKECFVVGVRKGKGQTLAIFYDEKYYLKIIDEGYGAANLCIIHNNNHDYIACANHTANECALYEICE